ncbi:MAG: hypothetical protein QXV84_01170 [Conexivisphaerales archaeon]
MPARLLEDRHFPCPPVFPVKLLHPADRYAHGVRYVPVLPLTVRLGPDDPFDLVLFEHGMPVLPPE